MINGSSTVAKSTNDGTTRAMSGQPLTVRQDEASRHYDALIRQLRLGPTHDEILRAIGVAKLVGCRRASVMATNLAVCLAKSTGQAVLLVAANSVNRVIDRAFPRTNGMSVYDLLREERPLDDAVQETKVANLFVIGTGKRRSSRVPYGCLTRFANLVEDMRHRFEFTLFDLPEASDSTPCYEMAASLDGVMLEVESRKVRRAAAQESLRQLRLREANVLGCVFEQM